MEIHKAWAMPNSKTFKIKPIKELILKYAKFLGDKSIVVDPFANESSIAQNLPLGTTYISNDLDTQYNTTYHLDALEFLGQFKDGSVDMVLYDPPYSPRQTSECYKKLGRTVTTQDTSSKPFAEFKKEIARILRWGGGFVSLVCGIQMASAKDLVWTKLRFCWWLTVVCTTTLFVWWIERKKIDFSMCSR